MDNNNQSSTENKIRKSLAAHLGIEAEDISLDDMFKEDLHMQASDLTDYLEQLTELGLPTERVDFVRVKTVGELVDSLKAEDYFE